MATKAQIDNFYKFASSQLDDDITDLSIDELYGLWRAENPTPEEYAATLAALKAAYAKMQAGERGEPIREALRETYERHGIVIDE